MVLPIFCPFFNGHGRTLPWSPTAWLEAPGAPPSRSSGSCGSCAVPWRMWPVPGSTTPSAASTPTRRWWITWKHRVLEATNLRRCQKMPNTSVQLSMYIYIYIIHYNPTYYYISTTLSVGDFSQKRCPKNGAPSEALLSPFKMTGGVWIPDFKSTSKTVFVIPWQNWCLFGWGPMKFDPNTTKIEEFLELWTLMQSDDLMCVFESWNWRKVGWLLVEPYFFQPSNICPTAAPRLEGKTLPKELAWAVREVHEKGFVAGQDQP